MQKIRGMFQKRSVQLFFVMTMALSMMVVGASAAEVDATSDTVITAFQTGFQSMASDALNMIAMIVPIALTVAAVVFLSRKAIGWFKSLAK